VETPEEITARFDGYAPVYDESAMHRGLAKAVAAFIRSQGVHDVLDVGTGTGLLLRSLPRAPWRLVGVDLAPAMLAIARAALPNARFELADASRLDFPDASFDLVTCVTVLHLVPDATAAMREWRRVLRLGGRIVLATFADDDLVTIARHAANERAIPVVDLHAPFGSQDSLERLGAAAGLVIDRIAEWRHESVADEPDYLFLITEFAAAA
jgi:ubiquinone/menaquinone biosynthesis C-methylase UbiE